MRRGSPLQRNLEPIYRTCPMKQVSLIDGFILVWLDPVAETNGRFFIDWIKKFRSIVNVLKIFNDIQEFILFVNTKRNELVFTIIPDNVAKTVIPQINEVNNLSAIYLFSNTNVNITARNMISDKIRGRFHQINVLYEQLKKDAHQCDHDLASISIISDESISEASSDSLDQSFMYSCILKEIMLDIQFKKKEKDEFIAFCRVKYDDDDEAKKVIDEFEKAYPYTLEEDGTLTNDPSPIWWYTRESFLYSMINKALRTQDTDTIIKMGFFMSDLHRQIDELHSESNLRKSITVYRGQGIIQGDFDRVKTNKGGLISFNSFLSTSLDSDVALSFAMQSTTVHEVIPVLFKINVDPEVCFANLNDDISYFKGREMEILFSMHSVFRIVQTRYDNNIWVVELKSTRNDDEQLRKLSVIIRKEIGLGTGWDRLGSLLVKMGNFEKADQIFRTLLSSTRKDDWQMLAHLFNQTGYIAKQKGNLTEALEYYEKSLKIQLEHLRTGDLDFATTYSNIGSVHDSRGDHKTALEFYQKALQIKQKHLNFDDLSLATTFNNIGSVHDSLGDYPTALSFYEKTIRIQENELPEYHPSLAITYSNIGRTHRLMEDYSVALTYYQKTLDIFLRVLPDSHPSLATAFNNIGLVHDLLGDYSSALSYYEKTLDIKNKALPSDHPSFATTFSNMAFVHKALNHYNIALQLFERALQVSQKTLPMDHVDIQDLKDQIMRLKRR